MSEIINKTSNSVKWTAINTIFNSAIQPFYRLGLALMLSPTEYGYLSIILLIISFTELLNNMGVGEVLIRENDITYKETSTLFYFNFIISIIFASTFYFSAGVIAEFYNFNQLEIYIKFLSIIVLINGTTSIFKFYLHRYFYFKVASLLLILRFFLEISITMSLLIYGIGLNGVVIGLISSFSIYGVLMSYFSIGKYGFKIKVYFSLKVLKKYLYSGLIISGQRILNFSSNKIDEVLIGKIFGASILGQYYLAKSILFQMESLLSRSFGQVMLPFFSKINNNKDQIRTRYVQMINILIFAGTPIFLPIFYFADNFVYLFLDEQWLVAIPVFQYLVFPTFLMFLNAGVTNSIMISINRIHFILLIEIIATVIFLSFVLISDIISVETLILYYVIYIYLKIITSKVLLWSTLKISFLYLISSLWRNFATILLLSTLFYIVDQFTNRYNITEMIILIITIPFFFLFINLLINRGGLQRAIKLLKKIMFS